MRISVIIPTVTGREDHFARCVQSYRETTKDIGLDLIVETDWPTCGVAWDAGMEHAHGDYVHLTCDDIEARPGWWQPAVEAVEAGKVPAPQCYDPSGYPQSCPRPGLVAPDWTPVAMSALPFFSMEQYSAIGPLFTAHYYTDDWVSWRARRAGWEPVLRTGYQFTHYYAQHRRGAGMSEQQRMEYDLAQYLQAQQMAEAGQWNESWPPNGG
jgi:glycosyltransferase involved in cell wall biosynthesis